jgi:hypothetical protein
MKTIAQQIKWDFKTNGNLVIKEKNGKNIYFEHSGGYWTKQEWDSQGNEIYVETSGGYWAKREYDSKGNEIYIEYSNGFWVKREYDSKGNLIYHEDSIGAIIDNRPKSCEGKIVEFDGEKFKLVKV